MWCIVCYIERRQAKAPFALAMAKSSLSLFFYVTTRYFSDSSLYTFHHRIQYLNIKRKNSLLITNTIDLHPKGEKTILRTGTWLLFHT